MGMKINSEYQDRGNDYSRDFGNSRTISSGSTTKHTTILNNSLSWTIPTRYSVPTMIVTTRMEVDGILLTMVVLRV